MGRTPNEIGLQVVTILMAYKYYRHLRHQSSDGHHDMVLSRVETNADRITSTDTQRRRYITTRAGI